MFCSVIISSVALPFINPDARPDLRFQACFRGFYGRAQPGLSSPWVSRSSERDRPGMRRILVVEDEQDIAELIAHTLTRAGHNVDTMGSGAAALTSARNAAPDLVILDLMLPGMDGLLVCQALRSEPSTAAVPIIMLTARGEESD